MRHRRKPRDTLPPLHVSSISAVMCCPPDEVSSASYSSSLWASSPEAFIIIFWDSFVLLLCSSSDVRTLRVCFCFASFSCANERDRGKEPFFGLKQKRDFRGKRREREAKCGKRRQRKKEKTPAISIEMKQNDINEKKEQLREAKLRGEEEKNNE